MFPFLFFCVFLFNVIYSTNLHGIEKRCSKKSSYLTACFDVFFGFDARTWKKHVDIMTFLVLVSALRTIESTQLRYTLINVDLFSPFPLAECDSSMLCSQIGPFSVCFTWLGFLQPRAFLVEIGDRSFM